MKKFLTVICVLSILSIASCKKDKKEEVVEKTTLEKIQAKWGVENITVRLADTSIPLDTTLVIPGKASDYFDFRVDGKVYSMFDGEGDTSTYALSGDSTILYQGFGDYKILVLTENSLKLYSKEEQSPELYEETLNLKK